MKKMKFWLFALLCTCMMLPKAAAVSEYERLIDDAYLLSDAEYNTVLTALDQKSEQLGCDLTICTVESLDGEEPEAATRQIYEGLGYAPDGTILLISIGDRKWQMTGFGACKAALPTDARDYISEAFVSDLTDGNYESAFLTYASLTADIVQRAQSGEPFKEPFDTGFALLIAFGAGLAVSLITVFVMRSQLKSVAPAASAANYVTEGSLSIVRQSDRFLYTTVTRTAKPKDNDSSSSSDSGSSGGSF